MSFSTIALKIKQYFLSNRRLNMWGEISFFIHSLATGCCSENNNGLKGRREVVSEDGLVSLVLREEAAAR